MLPKFKKNFKYVKSRTRDGKYSIRHIATGKVYRDIYGGAGLVPEGKIENSVKVKRFYHVIYMKDDTPIQSSIPSGHITLVEYYISYDYGRGADNINGRLNSNIGGQLSLRNKTVELLNTNQCKF